VNLTVALLAGLFLLLPGLTALATWNRLSTRHGARRPELPLTSVSALFIAFAVSIAAHLVGGLVVELIVLAAREAGTLAPSHWPNLTTLPVPMRAVMEMYAGPPPPPPALAPTTVKEAEALAEAARRAAEARTALDVAGLWMMILQVLAECALVFFVVSGRGAELLIDRLDIQGQQGWGYKHVVRPHRHGQTPVAYVLTALSDGKALGVGYRGVVSELRQGSDGELKVISLADPDAFIYELEGGPQVETPARAKASDKIAATDLSRLKMHAKRSLEGVVVLEAATVRNILINNWKPKQVATLEADLAKFIEAEAAAAAAKAKTKTSNKAPAKAAAKPPTAPKSSDPKSNRATPKAPPKGAR
jgi:hypothetical protein